MKPTPTGTYEGMAGLVRERGHYMNHYGYALNEIAKSGETDGQKLMAVAQRALDEAYDGLDTSGSVNARRWEG